MKELKQRIVNEGRLLDGGVLKVDHFLNHQIDVKLLDAMGKEFAQRFAGIKIDKILTIEASGIAIAVIAARYFNNVPVVFAKKNQSSNMDKETFESEVFSYTKQQSYRVRVAHHYLKPNECILIVDDFLAHGSAVLGLVDLVEQAKARTVGVGIAIEKGFQKGGKIIRDNGIRLESLAIIKSLENNEILFA